jgi:hypothetical protein
MLLCVPRDDFYSKWKRATTNIPIIAAGALISEAIWWTISGKESQKVEMGGSSTNTVTAYLLRKSAFRYL